MNKISKIERVAYSLNGHEFAAYTGKAIATTQGGHQFVILAADNDAIEEAWRRLGGLYPPDFSQVKASAIVALEVFDAKLRPTPETRPDQAAPPSANHSAILNSSSGHDLND